MNKFICLKCGYCCTTTVVVIVINPDLGIQEDNLKAINTLEEQCPHLIGNKPGEYSCAIHNKEWYKETPCYAFNAHKIGPCLVGKRILNKKIKG